MTDPIPDSSCRLVLIRHGQTNDNLVWRLSGWTDSPLNDHGRQQARSLARHIARQWRIDAIYASPLQRAAETARAIAGQLGVEPAFHAGLREMHFGGCDGLTEAEWSARYPGLRARVFDETDQSFCWPGGESRQGFHDRARAVFTELSRRHRGEAIAAVCHGGLISSYLCGIAGRPMAEWRDFMVHNCSVSVVEVDLSAGEPQAGIRFFNEIDHLVTRQEAVA